MEEEKREEAQTRGEALSSLWQGAKKFLDLPYGE